MELKSVPLDQIEDVPAPTSQARQLSLSGLGQISPIKLRRNGRGYEIVYGRRRVADLRAMGADTVQALIEDMDDEEKAKQSLAENVSRSSNPMSEAKDARYLRNVGYTQAEIAELMGTTQGLVSQRLSLFKLIPELRGMLERGEVGSSFARTACKLPEKFQKILAEMDRPTLKAAKELLMRFKVSSVDLDNLGVPEAPDDYIPPVVIRGEDAQRLAQGETLVIEWNNVLLIVSRKEE
jgi:ParB/RepB/Spo0J family partition protein